ncbi:xylulokinase [Ensifer sp. ENS06]|uniref:xylulokinase n=1 Tax=Ensifer sp. ENS06 TaxID=2769276 RepID=UPI00177DAC3A|nr:xylulokinase [Ensifer sp. ENS06]MBD9626952.1 xylulokinase [Ensifer sp. ENS06]
MFIGVDIGTSAVKIVLVNEAEEAIAEAAIPLSPSHPSPLWSEDDPDQWWRALCLGFDALAREAPVAMSGVRAIGLSGQMHSLVALDAADRPVRPAILWNDGRADQEASGLATLGLELQLQMGVLPMPGFTGPKLLWLAHNEPDIFHRMRALMLAKDYVRLKLSGEKLTDVSDAAGTWLLDQERREWSREALDACQVDATLLPRLIESVAAGGTLRPDLAAKWGLPNDVVIAGGAGDVAAGGIGIGAVSAGNAFISLGTSAQVFVADTAHRPQPERLVHAFCHALPGRWYRMAALLNGASPLSAAARWTGGEDVATLLAEAEADFVGPSRLLALPYLSGERTPHNDPLARGTLVGLTRSTTRSEVLQAFCEGVAFSLADGLDVLTRNEGRPGQLALIGGGARSRFWAKLIASVLDVSLVRHCSSERGPAFGAARIARLSVTGEDPATVIVPPAIEDIIESDPELHAAYQPRLEAFRDLYRALKPIWPAVSS